MLNQQHGDTQQKRIEAKTKKKSRPVFSQKKKVYNKCVSFKIREKNTLSVDYKWRSNNIFVREQVKKAICIVCVRL